VNILFSKQKYPIRTKLQWDSGLDKISLRNKILYDLDNLNINDTVNFLKVYLKTNRFYSTKSFIKFLLKETDLLSHYPVCDKKMLYKLKFIKGNLLKKGKIKPYNSQVYRIV